MSQKRKTRAGAATPTREVENGTAYETAHASTTEFTTPPAERQQFRVADFLHHGAESAISRRDLMALTGLPDRDLRRLIEAERRQGCPILSDCVGGYYLPGDSAERDRCIRSLRSRAAEIIKTADAIEKAVNE